LHLYSCISRPSFDYDNGDGDDASIFHRPADIPVRTAAASIGIDVVQRQR